MVVVAVSEEDGLALQMVVFEIVQNPVRLVAGVDDDAAEGFLVADDVAVGLQLADREGFYEHGGKLLSRVRIAIRGIT